MDFAHVSSYRLDWIVSFVAVAREGGFSAAAKVQHRSQPRVSSLIGDFERALGARLFDRSVHPPALTPEGRALLPHAEEILSHLDVFADVAASSTGVIRGEVWVGMYPSAAAFLYPPLVRHLQREVPTVTTVLHEGDTLALEGMLAVGDIELAVRPMLPLVRHDRFDHQELWREPLVAVVPTGHPLAGVAAVRLGQVAAFPLITIGEPASGVHQFETNLAFADAGLQPDIAFQTNQPQTLAAMVRAGLGVGVTNWLAMVTAECRGLELVRVAGTQVERRVGVWWNAGRLASPAVALVRDTIAQLPPPHPPK